MLYSFLLAYLYFFVSNFTIGVETGHDATLDFMNKGYKAKEIVVQAKRLNEANIGYHFFYIAGLAGTGHGIESALASAEIFNQTTPKIIGSSMLTIHPESELYREMQNGNWQGKGSWKSWKNSKH